MDRGTVFPRYNGPGRGRDTYLVKPAYVDRVILNRGVLPWWTCSGSRRVVPRLTGITFHTSDLSFLCRDRNSVACPEVSRPSRPGLLRHSHVGVLKSALSSLLRLTRDRGRWRSTSTGCPLHLPMTSKVNGYRSQPTGRGCAALVGVKGQDSAPPVMRDVCDQCTGTVLCVRHLQWQTVPRYGEGLYKAPHPLLRGGRPDSSSVPPEKP